MYKVELSLRSSIGNGITADAVPSVVVFSEATGQAMVFLVLCLAEPNYSPGTVRVVIGIASEQFFPPDSVDIFANTQDRQLRKIKQLIPTS